MEVVVCIVAAFAACLTLISGFGLGTILLPAFAFFFPIEVAVAATAVVHLANNLFKGGMLWRLPDWAVVARFGVPGAIAAFGGALVLDALGQGETIATWQLAGRTCAVDVLGLVIGGLILFFALFELVPATGRIAFSRAWLPVGGAISGFLGGVSGHQGALRSAFLVRLGLTKEAYVASGTMCAIMIDVARLTVYGVGAWRTSFSKLDGVWLAVLLGTLSAFLGSYIGRRLMHKITMQTVHLLVGWLLVFIGLAIASGAIGDGRGA